MRSGLLASFQRLFQSGHQLASKIPVIRCIPAFNSLPKDITLDNLRFYKLSNLVLTLGLMVHTFWICLFYYYDAYQMSLINIASVAIYIITIIINRKGHHFISATIMVIEIVLHQIIATYFFGPTAGFQSYIIVIALFPFLMPKGGWVLKFAQLLACFSVFVALDVLTKKYVPVYQLSDVRLVFLKVSNILFAFISLSVSGGYFNLAMHQTEDELKSKTDELNIEKQKSDELLLNILPAETASELKDKGFAATKFFPSVTILFTDFKDFTQICERLSPGDLVEEIDYYFRAIDEIVGKYGIEKIKTIGDAYMCAGGMPVTYSEHPQITVKCGLEILQFIEREKLKREKEGKVFFEIRIGVHTGSVVAGIVGTKKFAYDIWGDAVNIASRMESNGESGKLNISETTYRLISDYFKCNYRGKVQVKNKGEVDMYWVEHELTSAS